MQTGNADLFSLPRLRSATLAEDGNPDAPWQDGPHQALRPNAVRVVSV